jgi:hypothetical protein
MLTVMSREPLVDRKSMLVALKALFVLVIVCMTVWVQFAAVADLCSHDHAPDHFCMVCQVGAMAFLQTSITMEVAPTLLVEWIPSIPDFDAVHDILQTPSSPRAPPAA